MSVCRVVADNMHDGSYRVDGSALQQPHGSKVSKTFACMGLSIFFVLGGHFFVRKLRTICIRTVKMMLEYEPDVEGTNNDGDTPLLLACSHEGELCAKTVLELLTLG